MSRLAFIIYAVTAAFPSAAKDACQRISSQIPGTISYPNSTIYESSNSYYSGQERELNPGCIFRPTSTSEVAEFVKSVTAHKDTQFAVRGGGHTLWAGAANIEGGITVDMRLMNETKVSSNRDTASLGPGGIYNTIYPQLEVYNLTVMGGRVPGIGVGGFATGGGMTFLSRRQGFSCDNVHGYEVVLASGEVVYANETSHSDLWLALKGGSNNFGIVTRFDVATFPHDLMWYNLVQYNYTDSVLQAQAEAFSRFMEPENFDDAAMMGIFMDYQGGTHSIYDALWYADNVANPAVYDAFTEIPNNGGLAELTTTSDVVDTFGGQIPSTTGRAFQLTYSFENPDADVYMQLFKMWENSTSAFDDVEGMFAEFLIQPQPVARSTNLFGLTPGKTDYVIVDMTAAYSNESDDALVEKEMNDIVDKQKALLKSGGYLIDFVYLNYADISQNVYSTWGADNVAQLQAVSRKYDPNGVFQHMVPGGYKVFN